MSMSRFTILSYNICGVNNPIRQTELRMFLSQNQPSVLVLQEPKLNHLTTRKHKGKTKPNTPKHPPPFQNYTACNFKHPSEPTSILMYIHNSCTFIPLHDIPHTYRPKESRTLLGFIWVSSPLLPTPIVIGGAYISHNTTEHDIIKMTTCITNASHPLDTSPLLQLVCQCLL